LIRRMARIRCSGICQHWTCSPLRLVMASMTRPDKASSTGNPRPHAQHTVEPAGGNYPLSSRANTGRLSG
jgi:hypothetical protein